MILSNANNECDFLLNILGKLSFHLYGDYGDFISFYMRVHMIDPKLERSAGSKTERIKLVLAIIDKSRFCNVIENRKLISGEGMREEKEMIIRKSRQRVYGTGSRPLRSQDKTLVVGRQSRVNGYGN